MDVTAAPAAEEPVVEKLSVEEFLALLNSPTHDELCDGVKRARGVLIAQRGVDDDSSLARSYLKAHAEADDVWRIWDGLDKHATSRIAALMVDLVLALISCAPPSCATEATALAWKVLRTKSKTLSSALSCPNARLTRMALKLLTHIVRVSHGHARDAWRRVPLSNTTITKLASTRAADALLPQGHRAGGKRAPAPVTHKHVYMHGHDDDDVRSSFVRLISAYLLSEAWDVIRSCVCMRGLVGAVAGGLAADAPHVAVPFLAALGNAMFLSRAVHVRASANVALREGLLPALLACYAGPAHLRAHVHAFLVTLTTGRMYVGRAAELDVSEVWRGEAGKEYVNNLLLRSFPDPDVDAYAHAHEHGTAARVVCVFNHVHTGPLPHPALKFVNSITDVHDPLRRELIIAILRAFPSIVLHYIRSFPCALEARASPRWVCNVDLFSRVCDVHTHPDAYARAWAHAMGSVDDDKATSRSRTGAAAQAAAAPTSSSNSLDVYRSVALQPSHAARAHDSAGATVSTVDDERTHAWLHTCVCPRSLTRGVLNRAILHAHSGVTFNALIMLHALLRRLHVVLHALTHADGWSPMHIARACVLMSSHLPDITALTSVLSRPVHDSDLNCNSSTTAGEGDRFTMPACDVPAPVASALIRTGVYACVREYLTSLTLCLRPLSYAHTPMHSLLDDGTRTHMDLARFLPTVQQWIAMPAVTQLFCVRVQTSVPPPTVSNVAERWIHRPGGFAALREDAQTPADAEEHAAATLARMCTPAPPLFTLLSLYAQTQAARVHAPFHAAVRRVLRACVDVTSRSVMSEAQNCMCARLGVCDCDETGLWLHGMMEEGDAAAPALLYACVWAAMYDALPLAPDASECRFTLRVWRGVAAGMNEALECVAVRGNAHKHTRALAQLCDRSGASDTVSVVSATTHTAAVSTWSRALAAVLSSVSILRLVEQITRTCLAAIQESAVRCAVATEVASIAATCAAAASAIAGLSLDAREARACEACAQVLTPFVTYARSLIIVAEPAAKDVKLFISKLADTQVSAASCTLATTVASTSTSAADASVTAPISGRKRARLSAPDAGANLLQTAASNIVSAALPHVLAWCAVYAQGDVSAVTRHMWTHHLAGVPFFSHPCVHVSVCVDAESAPDVWTGIVAWIERDITFLVNSEWARALAVGDETAASAPTIMSRAIRAGVASMCQALGTVNLIRAAWVPVRGVVPLLEYPRVRKLCMAALARQECVYLVHSHDGVDIHTMFALPNSARGDDYQHTCGTELARVTSSLLQGFEASPSISSAVIITDMLSQVLAYLGVDGVRVSARACTGVRTTALSLAAMQVVMQEVDSARTGLLLAQFVASSSAVRACIAHSHETGCYLIACQCEAVTRTVTDLATSLAAIMRTSQRAMQSASSPLRGAAQATLDAAVPSSGAHAHTHLLVAALADNLTSQHVRKLLEGCEASVILPSSSNASISILAAVAPAAARTGTLDHFLAVCMRVAGRILTPAAAAELVAAVDRVCAAIADADAFPISAAPAFAALVHQCMLDTVHEHALQCAHACVAAGTRVRAAFVGDLWGLLTASAATSARTCGSARICTAGIAHDSVHALARALECDSSQKGGPDIATAVVAIEKAKDMTPVQLRALTHACVTTHVADDDCAVCTCGSASHVSPLAMAFAWAGMHTGANASPALVQACTSLLRACLRPPAVASRGTSIVCDSARVLSRAWRHSRAAGHVCTCTWLHATAVHVLHLLCEAGAASDGHGSDCTCADSLAQIGTRALRDVRTHGDAHAHNHRHVCGVAHVGIQCIHAVTYSPLQARVTPRVHAALHSEMQAFIRACVGQPPVDPDSDVEEAAQPQTKPVYLLSTPGVAAAVDACVAAAQHVALAGRGNPDAWTPAEVHTRLLAHPRSMYMLLCDAFDADMDPAVTTLLLRLHARGRSARAPPSDASADAPSTPHVCDSARLAMARLLLRLTVADAPACITPPLLPALAAAYTASLSVCDRTLRALMYLYEKTSPAMTASAFNHAWSFAAVAHVDWDAPLFAPVRGLFIVASRIVRAGNHDWIYGAYMNVSSRLGSSFYGLDAARVNASVTHTPVHRSHTPEGTVSLTPAQSGAWALLPNLNMDDVASDAALPLECVPGAQKASRWDASHHSMVYDPSYVYATLYGAAQGAMNTRKFASSGALALSIVGCSSSHEQIRTLAYACLGLYTHACTNVRALAHMHALLTYMRACVRTPCERVPHVWATTCARIADAVMHTHAQVYAPLCAWLTRAHMHTHSTSDIPGFYAHLRSDNDLSAWMCTTTCDGVWDARDYGCMRMLHAFHAMMASARVSYRHMDAVLRMLSRACDIVRVPLHTGDDAPVDSAPPAAAPVTESVDGVQHDALLQTAVALAAPHATDASAPVTSFTIVPAFTRYLTHACGLLPWLEGACDSIGSPIPGAPRGAVLMAHVKLMAHIIDRVCAHMRVQAGFAALAAGETDSVGHAHEDVMPYHSVWCAYVHAMVRAASCIDAPVHVFTMVRVVSAMARVHAPDMYTPDVTLMSAPPAPELVNDTRARLRVYLRALLLRMETGELGGVAATARASAVHGLKQIAQMYDDLHHHHARNGEDETDGAAAADDSSDEEAAPAGAADDEEDAAGAVHAAVAAVTTAAAAVSSTVGDEDVEMA